MKEIIKKIIPEKFQKPLRPFYHGTVAILANLFYGRPSSKFKYVIGVTGTAGKSTTINLLAHILNSNGIKTGFITTANLNEGQETKLNKVGISMSNEWALQKSFQTMLANKCQIAIIECTSEGLAQNRHLGTKFLGALFTNLSPAHIDAHGSFHAYKHAKGKLFQTLNGKKHSFIGVNLDDEHWQYFASFPAENKFGISLNESHSEKFPVTNFKTEETNEGIKIYINNQEVSLNLIGKFNAYNTVLAAAAANHLGVSWGNILESLKKLPQIPGRMESIENKLGAKIIVDFACEPKPMIAALEAVSSLPHKKLIHIFGSTGGLRDKSKRFEFGKISAQYADQIVITNDDVYDSDPNEIAENIKTGIESVSQNLKKVQKVEIVLDRKTAIAYALKNAQNGDLLIFTGKSSEQFLILPGNKRIPWDEREIIKNELKNL